MKRSSPFIPLRRPVLDLGENPIHFFTPSPHLKAIATPKDQEIQAKHREKLVTRSNNVEQRLVFMYPDRDVIVNMLVHYTHPSHEKPTANWKEESQLDYYRSLYKDLGATFTVMPFVETEETLSALDVQDLGVILLCRRDKASVLEWTEFNGHYRERCLMGLWMLAGGNLLFGNWGNPQTYGDPLDQLQDIDFDEIADAFENDSNGVKTNEQPAFSELMRRGQWLGYWKEWQDGESGIWKNGEPNEDPPDLIYNKIKAAWDYRLLYPRWLFLHDFPTSQFESPIRGRQVRSYSLYARDKVVPRFRPIALQQDAPFFTLV